MLDERGDNVNIAKEGKCCLCGGKYSMYGNNPFPLSSNEADRCCASCNESRVIPARIQRAAALTVLERGQQGR
ncbi:MAG: hypothetical protein E7298_14230 [Lachnospiraceae bacterium]|nr:hypothetical protein [Lachnospiraceae bacterium]